MDITQVGTGSGSGNTTSASFTPSGTRQVGDVVVVVGYQRPGTALSVAATGLTFTAVVTATNDATYGSMGAWWARYESTSNPQITVTGSSSANLSIAAAGVVLRGVDPSSTPLTNVGSITNQAAAASFTVTGPTGVAAGTVMIGVGGSLDNNAPTADWTGGAGTGSSVTVDNSGGTDNALGLAWEWVASGTAGNFVYTETAVGNDAGRTLIFGAKNDPATYATATGSITLSGSASAGTLQSLTPDPVGVTDTVHVVEGVTYSADAVGVTDAEWDADLTPPSGTPASATGDLTLSGSAAAVGVGAATGSLDLSGSAAAVGVAAAAGSLTLDGSAIAVDPDKDRSESLTDDVGVTDALTVTVGSTVSGDAVGVTDEVVLTRGVTATGSLTLSGTVTAAAPAAASGAITLSGSATGAGVGAASGALTLSGTAVGRGPAVAAGSITLSGSGVARGAATAAGSVSLSGTVGAAAAAPAAAGSLSLSGSAAAAGVGVATGSLTLSGEGTAQVGTVDLSDTRTDDVGVTDSVILGMGVQAAGSLTLTGAASAGQRVDLTDSVGVTDETVLTRSASAAGSITLSGSATGVGVGAASGSITLGGSVTGAGPAAAAGSVSLSGSAAASATGTATGTLTLSGSAEPPQGEDVERTLTDDVGVTDTTALTVGVVAAGSLTLAGQAGAGGQVVAAGSISLTGAAIAGVGGGVAGALTLAGSTAAVAGAQAAGSLTLVGQAGSRAPAAATGLLALSGQATTSAAVTAAGSIALSGTAWGAESGGALGSLTLTGSAAAAAVASSTGALTLGGAVTVTGHADALGLITLSGFADGYAHGQAEGHLTLSGVGWMAFPAYSTTGHLTLSGSARVRAITPTPPRLEAMLTGLLAGVGAVKVWAVDSTPRVRGVAEGTTVQVEVRAFSKQAARARAYEARELILALPGGVWHDGIVSSITDMQGPAWTPDTDGAPRYVFRCTVNYRRTRNPSMT